MKIGFQIKFTNNKGDYKSMNFVIISRGVEVLDHIRRPWLFHKLQTVSQQEEPPKEETKH